MSRPSKPPEEKLVENEVNKLEILLKRKGLDKSKHGDPLQHAENKQRKNIIDDLKTWILSLSKGNS